VEAESTQPRILEYIPDPIVKNCPKCDSVMHWCHEDRQSGRTPGGAVYRGCTGKTMAKHHPQGNCFVCLFCGYTIPD
jgi:hypothetical protein